MSEHRVSARPLLFAAAILVAFGTRSPAQTPTQRPVPVPSTNPGPDSPSPEDVRERQSMERFLSLLEKNPRRGTALDRVYGYHVERGTLDAFVTRYEDRVARDANDGTAWMILGLLESQRGQDAAAIKALARAEAIRADDPLPSFYLGQSLVLIGRPEEAAGAYERAIQRKPRRNDLLDIFQALGRVYQRGQKLDQALAVWGRLEQLFPGDQQVQEQVAAALAEEGQAEPALGRYENLARTMRDPFRQAQPAMTAADLKVRLGRSEPALHDFESLLGKLRPDSWLYREVRRKIEDVFLRNDDHAGLAGYYERWVKKNPEDVEALVRLGRSLAAQGRVADARGWYEKAVKLAPSRRDLRLALIGQLVQDKKIAEAAAQYEALDRAEPNNPDTLRDWGALVLRDTPKPEAARKAAAASVWRKLMEAKPGDPVTVAQVADLFRQAEMVDDALALYRQAIALAPNDAQYREYLGEYLHALKRSDEALAEWGKMAEGANHNARNLGRLAEVLPGFGYIRQAIPPMIQAVELDRDDFDLGMKLAELLHRAERYDDARTRLDATEKLAERDEEETAVLEARIKNDQAAGQLAARGEALRKELESAGKVPAASWSRLARYLEADGKLPEAGRAIARAIEADPRSVQAWALAARIRESAGNLADSAEAYRRLAEIDRRNRTEYLTQVAKLEARLGRTELALKAGRELIAAAPGNPESYESFAQLCFQIGKPDEGLDTLRRAVRVNSNDTKILLALAETLAGQFRLEEAIEMYWRAYEKAEGLDARLSTVSRLTELYLQRNQLDRLLARLQREKVESQQNQREVSICLAQAYAGSGDLGMARSELERLLAANARDTQLLQQLSKLAEEEGDLEGAAKHQRQLNELAPGDEGQLRLSQLLVRHGDLEEAQGIWTRMALARKDPQHMLGAIDRLLGSEKPAAVLEITESMIRKDPHDWEVLYREGLALAALGKNEDATQRFRRLLDLRRSDDDKGVIARARSRDPKLQSAGSRTSSFSRRQTLPLEDRINAAFQVRLAAKLESRYSYGMANASTIWTPTDFGQARMAAIGWLVSLSRAKDKAQEDAVLSHFRAARDKVPRDPRALWDWYYLNLVLNDNSGTYEAARVLSRATPSDPMALWIYLSSLGSRQFGQGPRYYVAPGTEGQDGTPPLPADEIDHVLASYRSLRQRRPELAARQILGAVAVELKRAKRTESADALYRESIDASRQVDEVASVMSLAGERGDVEGLIALSDRYERLQAGKSSASSGSYYLMSPAYSMSQAMSVRAKAKAYDDILRLLDYSLAAARRKNELAGKSRGRSSNFGGPSPSIPTPSTGARSMA